MRCAWREMAPYLDVLIGTLHAPLFFACWFFLSWYFFYVERPWRKARYGRSWWWSAPGRLPRKDRKSFEQWLRDTGQGWLLGRVWRAICVACLVALAWPFVSPTYCENVACKAFKDQLKPRTDCLRQSGSPSDSNRGPA
jgi:hypothetical protein